MAVKPRFDPRKMMEKAIAAMKRSINEPRKVGRASPFVVASLVKPVGPNDTAFRGQLRPRDQLQGAASMNRNHDIIRDIMSRSLTRGMPRVRIPTEIPTKCRDSIAGFVPPKPIPPIWKASTNPSFIQTSYPVGGI